MTLETRPFGAVLYVDILGYGKRAEEDAKKTGRPVEDIRSDYISSIERRLNELQNRADFPLYKTAVSPDSWLVFIDRVWSGFEVVGEIMKAGLPLEVVVHAGKFERSMLIDRSDEVVKFLKTNIVEEYRRFHKKTKGQALVETFILVTAEAYGQIECKGMCVEKEKFFLVERQELEQELMMSKFLRKVNLRRPEYRNIEKLYVEPNNYAEIKRTLEEHHIVILIGDAEEGKTYTAIRLLLEYSDTYEPVYIPDERKIEQWEYLRGKKEIEESIVYLEDPWGKVEFERTQSLFSEITAFITEARKKKSKVVVTSREKVFREFEKRKETAKNLYDYGVRFKVHLTYTTENLERMLRKYLDVFQPPWENDGECITIALRAVGVKLRTPMSIKKLMDYSREVSTISDLQLAIARAAQDTKVTFAAEIREMFNRGQYDKLIFLSLTHIGIDVGVARSYYELLSNKLISDPRQSSRFDRLLEEFDEVETTDILRFIHPTYWDAFNTALADNDRPTNLCLSIFKPILLELWHREETAASVGWAVRQNFDRIPEAVRNELLFALSDNPRTITAVGRTVVEKFDRIPEAVRNELLFALSKSSRMVVAAAWAVCENFDRIPEAARNQVLLSFWQRYEHVRGALNGSTKLLPGALNGVLTVLTIMEEVSGYVASTVIRNYDKLPSWRKMMLLGFSKEEMTAWHVAYELEDNFDKIPERERNRLLVTLSKNEQTAKTVRRIMARNPNKIPNHLRNSIRRYWKLSSKLD